MQTQTASARGLRALCFLAGAITVALAGSATADEAGYRLGVMDKLRVRVAEWQPADGTIRNWDAVSGDYTIGPTGSLSLPFIGDLPAAGKTAGEVAKTIGEELRGKFALRNLPSASVEIAQFRPVFLAGDVHTPGEYPFTPNLTVLKAISLAGGLLRSDLANVSPGISSMPAATPPSTIPSAPGFLLAVHGCWRKSPALPT